MLIECRDSGAYQILKRNPTGLVALRHLITMEPKEEKDDHKRFEVVDLLEGACRAAQQARVAYVGTEHVLLAMFSPKYSNVQALLLEAGYSEKMCEAFLFELLYGADDA